MSQKRRLADAGRAEELDRHTRRRLRRGDRQLAIAVTHGRVGDAWMA